MASGRRSGAATLLLLAFAPTLWALAVHAAGSDLHSHVLLIPFVSAYLIYIQRERLPKRFVSSPAAGVLAGMAGLAALLAARLAGTSLSGNDYLTLMTLSFLCFLVALGFIFLGRAWMASVAFPAGFLVFMVPMPDAMANALEIGSQLASAEAANLFFVISGTPFLREGLNFQLPNIALRVAQECSGIRSSWVLFITSANGLVSVPPQPVAESGAGAVHLPAGYSAQWLSDHGDRAALRSHRA